MKRTVVLTGRAVVNFRKVIEHIDDEMFAELVANNDMRESLINEADLLDIEWVHDDVDIKVTP